MNRRRQSADHQSASRPGSDSAATSSNGSTVRSVLLAGLLALFVARPLLPSEGPVTAEGEGLQFVLLALVLAGAWLVAGVWQGGLRVRLGWVDAGWLALVVCFALSTSAAYQHRAARPAINGFWEWVALGVGFLLARQLIVTAREARAAAAVMIALAATLSGFGLHQYFISGPETSQLYQSDPERVLREMGIPPGSTEHKRFEDRLRSTEPMATFGLPNSLAGVLAPWLVVLTGIALVRNANGTTAGWRRIGFPAVLCLLIGLIGACLLLTKSRSAWIAVAIGFAGLAAFALRRGRLASRRTAFALAGLFCLLIVAAVLAGGLDREVLTEASKSLGYRWQYWQSSLAMIADHPWLGCGPGNFQDEYTRYKLPEASEVVADPHNLVMEVWATAGTPALVALLAIFLGTGCDLLSIRRRLRDAAPAESECESRVLWLLFGGVLGGFSLAYVVGLSATVPLTDAAFAGGLCMMAAVLALLFPWIERGALPASLPLLGAAVLAVNLLAAGGIGFPGVAGSLWLLLGLGLSVSRFGVPPRLLSKTAVAAAAVGMLLALGIFAWGDYLPVMNARLNLLQAEADAASWPQRQAALKEAAAADPLWEKPWRQMAALEFQRWQRQRDRTALEHWRQALEEAARRRPHWAAASEQAGNEWLEVFNYDHRQADLRQAIACYEQAVELYPHHAETRARLATALAAAGEHDRAAEQARQALDLDALTPHADQKLSSKELRAAMQTIAVARQPASD